MSETSTPKEPLMQWENSSVSRSSFCSSDHSKALCHINVYSGPKGIWTLETQNVWILMHLMINYKILSGPKLKTRNVPGHSQCTKSPLVPLTLDNKKYPNEVSMCFYLLLQNSYLCVQLLLSQVGHTFSQVHAWLSGRWRVEVQSFL